MKNQRVSGQAAVPLLLVGDILSYLITVGPSAGALCLCVALAVSLFPLGPWVFYPALFLLPAVFFTIFVFLVFCLRLLLPPLRPGTYPASFNRGMLAWILHLGLSRSGLIFGLREFILSASITKFLFWRALGGRVDFQTTAALSVSLVDLPLIRIDRGCTLGDGVFMCAHHFVGNELVLGRIHLEENVFISKDCTFLGGVHLKARSWMGMKCILGPDLTVGADARIGAGNVLNRRAIADGEKIGRGDFREAEA